MGRATSTSFSRHPTRVPLWGERENSTGLIWIKNYRQEWATTKTPIKIALLLYEDSDLQLITGIVVIRETAEKQLVSIIAVIFLVHSKQGMVVAFVVHKLLLYNFHYPFFIITPSIAITIKLSVATQPTTPLVGEI